MIKVPYPNAGSFTVKVNGKLVMPNAWDVKVSAGGSSGGTAVALAQRMLPVADGSDFMGSLRNPAGWNNVFGMRPSQGRVPYYPAQDVWVSQLGTDGPMAPNVNYEELDQPAVMRRNRTQTVEAMRNSGVDTLDIPAFLRKQAD